MDQIWAPWRMAYLQRERSDGSCFLCALGESPDDPIVVWRGEHTYALLNAFPYANGHVMVAPYAHEGALERLPDATIVEVARAVATMLRALRIAYQPEGFNVGANLGSAAGAGHGDHVHIHVVPRWSRDTNFMTTTASTRVIPESLPDTARRVREALAGLAPAEEAPE